MDRIQELIRNLWDNKEWQIQTLGITPPLSAEEQKRLGFGIKCKQQEVLIRRRNSRTEPMTTTDWLNETFWLNETPLSDD